MQKLTFERGQGGVPKSLPGQDHISGLLFYVPDTVGYPTGTGDAVFDADNPIHAISTVEQAAKYGIADDGANWFFRVLAYHIAEALRMNPGIALYVGIFPTETSEDFAEILQMQEYAGGDIRQIGIYMPAEADASMVTSIQGQADMLRDQAQPLSVILSPNVADVTALPALRAAGNERVSAVIAQDGQGEGRMLYDDTANTNTDHGGDGEAINHVGIIGLTLGALSRASVHESIAWVQKFPAGIGLGAFSDGSLARNVDRATREALDADGYIFLTTYPGINGTFLTDSHTLEEPTSDYAYIEAVRTMDKAERGVRTYLTPYLGAPLYVDAETGKLRPDTVAFLKTLAGKQLEDMEAAGELSGYKVEIDPEQNVLSTSMVEFVLKQVQVGVMRRMNVKIGYTTKIE